MQTSHYRIDGREVSVETCVHPSLNLVAVRIESPLVASGDLEVVLDFAYPARKNSAWAGDCAAERSHDRGDATSRGTHRFDPPRGRGNLPRCSRCRTGLRLPSVIR